MNSYEENGAEAPEDEDEDEDSTPTRQRGTIRFPYADLNDAVALARAVWETGGRRSQLDQVAPRMRHDSIRSGAFRNKVSAAKLFGLIRTKNMDVTLTPLGEAVVDPSQEGEARADAFLRVPLFNQIFEDHRGGLLPGAPGLEQEMAGLGVAPKQTERARQVFQRSAEQAGFFASGRDRLVPPTRSASVPTVASAPPETTQPVRHSDPMSGKPAVIEALFRMMPNEGQPWPKAKREKWRTTLEQSIDLAYEDDELVTTTDPSEPWQPSEQSQNDAEDSANQL